MGQPPQELPTGSVQQLLSVLPGEWVSGTQPMPVGACQADRRADPSHRRVVGQLNAALKIRSGARPDRRRASFAVGSACPHTGKKGTSMACTDDLVPRVQSNSHGGAAAAGSGCHPVLSCQVGSGPRRGRWPPSWSEVSVYPTGGGG